MPAFSKSPVRSARNSVRAQEVLVNHVEIEPLRTSRFRGKCRNLDRQGLNLDYDLYHACRVQQYE